jgi:hypothetical protein
MGMLRNNCLLCHNSSPRSAARDTAFVLDPIASFTRRELEGRLSARATFMGPRGKPILTPGKPKESEIALRLRGVEGRRRMPPLEGGVPDPDVELRQMVEGWIAGWK